MKDSTLEADLKAAGVDPKNPPDWATLSKGFTSMAAATPVMSLFAKSLGVQCTDCHSDPMFGIPAGRKNIVTRMWDNWVHGLRLKDGGTLFCDSCHQGKEEFLDRKDDAALTAWMQANFVAKFTRADGQAQTCASCHGTPFNKSFLDDWEAGK